MDAAGIRTSLLSVHQELQAVPGAERSRWNTIWMMLVGCWYLLNRAEPFTEEKPINYDRAVEFALDLLRGNVGAESEWVQSGPHPWPAGFYLVSAEHRLANSLDRLTQLFAGAKLKSIPALEKIYDRCEYLAKSCPHCGDVATYAGNMGRAAAILREVAKAKNASNEQTMHRLAKVYRRVNEIKHGLENLPKVQTPIEQEPTKQRWVESSEALEDMVTLIDGFASHRHGCGSYAPMQRQ